MCVRDGALTRGSLAFTGGVEDVIDETAFLFDVDIEDLVGPSRREPIVFIRLIAMAAARSLGASYPSIGRAFNRDHTTVMSACKRVARSPQLAWRADAIVKALTSDAEAS